MEYFMISKSNLACPRCESKNIFTGRKIKVNSNDNVVCSSCSYSQLAVRFNDKWKIITYKKY